MNLNDSVGIQDIRHMIKRYVTFIMVGSVCLAPGKVCVAVLPGPRGKRGPKRTKGRKPRERRVSWDLQVNKGSKA